MPTPAKGARLGGSPSHERRILANLAASLFEHGSITTTEGKAKRLRPFAERLITFAKRGDLHARRRVMRTITNREVVHTLFTDIGPAMAERNGGYTRLVKIVNRKGDNAPMAVIELVMEPVSPKQAVVREAEAAAKRTAPKKKTAPAADAKKETPEEEVVADETAAEKTPAAKKPAAKSADKPAAKSADKPAAKSADKPAAKSADKPAAKSADKPAAKSADKPAAKSADKK